MVRRAVLWGFLGLCCCSTSPSTAQKQRYGVVGVQSTPALTDNAVGGNPGPSTFAYARFNRDISSLETCAVEHLSSACDLVTCPQSEGNLDGGSSPTAELASAGIITVSGGHQAVTLVPEGGAYSAYFAPQQLWDGGETLTVQAAGAEVPGFEVTLVAPAQPTMTAPTLAPAILPTVAPDGSVTSFGGSTIVRSQDLVFQWTGGTPSTSLQILVGEGGTSSLQCVFDAGAGMGVIPAAVLGHLSSGPGGLSTLVVSTAVASGADWSTTVIATTFVGDVKGEFWPAGAQGGQVGVELQ